MNLYNLLLEDAIVPLGDLVLGTDFIGSLKRWRKLQWLDSAELHRLQTRNLSSILRFATENVPYYRDRSLRLTGDSEADLTQFPIIHKKDIKAAPDAFVHGDKSRLVCSRSSGSSGIQGAVYMTKREESQSQAIQTLWWEWAGFRLGETYLQRGMTVERGCVKRVKDFLLRTTYLSAYQLDEQDAIQWLQHLRRHPHQHMGGYASSLYVFAHLAKQLDIRDVSFDSVISWGDKMFPHYRETIEQQFHTRVFDTYGCTEGLMIAGQCERHVFHVMTPHIYLELLDDDDQPVKPGAIGRIVVTRLDNYSMPLIRYALGDLAERGDNSLCVCGRQFPTLARVIGRDTDVVKTPSGKHLIVHFFTGIMEHFREIKQFRVIQHMLEHIEIEYIPDSGFHPDVLGRIANTMRSRAGEALPIEFREVAFIPSTPSGKPQIVKSVLAGGR